MYGVGLRIQGSGVMVFQFRIWGLSCLGVGGLGLRVQDLGVWGLGFRGLGLRLLGV